MTRGDVNAASGSTKVLILGASGSIARVATDLFLEKPHVELTLFVRNKRKLQKLGTQRVSIIEGDVLDADKLKAAMHGQDVVYANLAGDLAKMADAIVRAMKATGVRRLIFISSMGIYDEVPGQRYRSVLDPYRDAARVIEASTLDYTILRPAWFTDADEIDYELTQKGEPFKGGVVSRKSVAALVVALATTPGLEVGHSIGVSKPD
jgi:uncharacterized protein YbjT (DUF2867 family)